MYILQWFIEEFSILNALNFEQAHPASVGRVPDIQIEYLVRGPLVIPGLVADGNMLGASHTLLTADSGINLCDFSARSKESFGLFLDG
jgi:hypothetical protein